MPRQTSRRILARSWRLTPSGAPGAALLARLGIGALCAGLAITAAPATAAPGDDKGATPPHKRPTLELTQFVNPLIGTAVNSTSGYAGNINPGAKVPFGMVTFGPDMPRTNFNGSGGGLVGENAAKGQINFFSLTHLNGVGCPGQGAVGMRPGSTPTPIVGSTGRVTPVGFSTSTEKASPGYYSVGLDTGVKVETTATNRTGLATFSYPGQDKGYLSLDMRLNGNANGSGSRVAITPDNVSLSVSPDGRTITGKTVAPAFCTPYGTPYNSNVYFHAELNRSLKAQSAGSTVNTVKDGATVLQYDLPAGDPTLSMRVGISAVSVANARLNLETENASTSFQGVRDAAVKAWNARLNTVQVDKAANPGSLTTSERTDLVKLYSSLYRVLGSPTTYSDVNGDFRSMDAKEPYAGGVDRAGGVEERPVANVRDYSWTNPDGSAGSYATHYSGLSLWDTYRSQAQLLALLAPDVASDVNQSLVVDGLQCGAFPHWVDASDDSTPMAGDSALPVIAGSYAFGAKDFDVTTAARLTKQSAFDPSSACNGRKSFPDMETYLANGYYPNTTGNSSSETIERVNDDRAAAAFLDAVPESVRTDPSVAVTSAQIAELYDRAEWWVNIFDPATKTLMQREAGKGAFIPGDAFHESTEPNYFWSFGFAFTGLIEASGGKDAGVERLNRLFGIDSTFSIPPTKRSLNGGEGSMQFYIGNEMGYPLPYAYNWAGKPASTQYVVQQIMQQTFDTGRAGLPGNDDMGATTSWYVWSALGLFPVVASADGLAISTPQFPGITVWMGNKKLRLETDKDATAAPFIQSARLGDQAYPASWLPMRKVRPGATLSFTLGSSPSSWAAADALTPPSGADANYTRMTARGDVK